jgi:lysophospholipase L1-like esterase
VKTRRTYWLVLAITVAALAVSPGPLSAVDKGPTPFPDAKNEAAWPGHGPIRVFGWMVDNRNWFWTQRQKDQGAVVFIGDSLTGNWKDMGKAFPGLRVANRGIGGDVSRGVLFRFREDVLDLKPRAVVLCIGSNDLSAHADPAITAGNIAAILDQVRAQTATLPIVLCLIPPRDSAVAPTKPGAQADLNARIAKLGAGKEHLVVLDLFTPLAGPDGKPIVEYFAKDKLHFAAPGYQKWAELLRPAFVKLGVK